MQKKELCISDFDRCLPGNALSWTERDGCWLLRRYRVGSKEGVMLTAGYMNSVPDVAYPLNAEGWHGIWVGIYSPDDLEVRFNMRLTGDWFPRAASARPYMHATYDWIVEEFWKYADLTGQQIMISKPEKTRAYLAYIKLKPLSEEKVEEIKRDREQQETKICGVACDVGGVLGGDGPPYTPDRVKQILDPYIGTDLKRFCWWAMDSEMCLYHTKIGTITGEGQTKFFIPTYKYTAEFMATSLREGWDPLKVAVDYAHENGLELWINFRMAQTYAVGTYYDNFISKFQREHQHLRCVEKNGNFHPSHLSYAFPEVSDYKISLLKEQAEYDADGVYLDFTSFPPYLLYEQPLVEGFKKEYGEDPRKLHDRDLKWLNYRAMFMTRFTRDLRRTLDEVGQRLGRRIPLAVQVYCDVVFGPDPHCYKIDQNLVWGLNLETWIKEGLIDIVAPSYRGKYNDMPIHYFKNLTKDTKCEVWPCIGAWTHHLYPDDYDWIGFFGERKGPAKLFGGYGLDGKRVARQANDLYNQGANAIFLWEGINPGISTRWNIVSRIGHKKELAKEYGTIGRYDGYPEGIIERKVKFLDTSE